MDDGVGGAGFFDDAIDVPPFDPSLGVADDDSASRTHRAG
jgi:hypothetical protein